MALLFNESDSHQIVGPAKQNVTKLDTVLPMSFDNQFFRRFTGYFIARNTWNQFNNHQIFELSQRSYLSILIAFLRLSSKAKVNLFRFDKCNQHQIEIVYQPVQESFKLLTNKSEAITTPECL